MENTQDRETLIKDLVRAGVFKYADYLKEMNYTIDHKAFEEVMNAFNMGLDYEETSNSFYGLIEDLERLELLDENNLNKTSIKAVNVILEKIENNQIKKHTLKGYELTEEKIKGLIPYYEYLEKTEDSFNKYDKYLEEQGNKREKIYKSLEEQYTNYLKSVNKEDREKQILDDIEKAVSIVKENYLGNLKEDLEKTNITVYIETIHNFRCFKKGDEFVKGLNALYWYLYPFFRNQELLTYFDNESLDITEKLISYTELLINAINENNLNIELKPIERKGLSNERTIKIPYGRELEAFTKSINPKTKCDELGYYEIKVSDDYKILKKFLDSNKIAKTYGMATDKLLTVLNGEFIANNNKRNENINTHVVIDLLEYAKCIQYDLTEKVMNTAEQQEEEKERIKKRKQELSKKIKGYLRNIGGEGVQYRKGGNGGTIYILDKFDVDTSNNKILVNMGYTYSKLLLDMPLSEQFICLLKIDNTHVTTYQIAKKIQQHYCMYSNIENGTNTLISVKSLLESTQLSTYEDLKKINAGDKWCKRIKKPIESALHELFSKEDGINFLKDYGYRHAKHELLTDEEMADVEPNDDNYKCAMSYEEWLKLYIEFEVNEPKEDTERRLTSAINRKKRVIDAKAKVIKQRTKKVKTKVQKLIFN